MIPADLLQLSGAYWNSCVLHAAVKLDVFTQMAQGAASTAEISKLTGSNERGMTMLLNSLSAMDLLNKTGNLYSLPPLSAKYLSKESNHYLGHIILHHHHLMSAWARLDEAVKTGGPVRVNSSRTDDETARQSFLLGMFNLATLNAPLIVPAINLSGRRNLLDLGGGPGTYAIHFCLHNPELRATVYDLPTTQRFAEETVQRFNLADRISFSAGDIITDHIGSGYDVVWISQLLHSEGPKSAAIILKKAAQSLLPDGLVIVQEFVLDDNHACPAFPALFSLNMLLGTQAGQSYSQSELSDMMTRAGIANISRLPLMLPNGAGIMIGTIT
jgi:SAM-dependent methyltransferase